MGGSPEHAALLRAGLQDPSPDLELVAFESDGTFDRVRTAHWPAAAAMATDVGAHVGGTPAGVVAFQRCRRGASTTAGRTRRGLGCGLQAQEVRPEALLQKFFCSLEGVPSVEASDPSHLDPAAAGALTTTRVRRRRASRRAAPQKPSGALTTKSAATTTSKSARAAPQHPAPQPPPAHPSTPPPQVRSQRRVFEDAELRAARHHKTRPVL